MNKNKLIRKLKDGWWAVKLLYAQIIYGFPSEKLKIIGVTGTNGKTTTATLLYKITKELGYKSGFIGTTGTEFDGREVNINRKIPTTPDSVTLTKIFSKMVGGGCEYVFMEVSSHAIDQNRILGINFTGGIFTNLTQDHLDYHKSMEAYFLAKKKFFDALSPHAFALSNTDDEHGQLILADTRAKKVVYGFSEFYQTLGVRQSSIFKGEITRNNFSGLELNFNGSSVKSKLIGKFNAYNMLAVWSACSLLGFDMEKVNKILENVDPPVGRFTNLIAPSGTLVIIDYAHSPDALENVLKTAIDLKSGEGKIISVFGCGGDRDPLKRRIMGRIGAELSDIAIFTADNPRSEDPMKIIAQMKTDLTMPLSQKVITLPDRRGAIKKSLELAKKGDIILCAGKGHETYQEIKGIKHHFNDEEEYRKIFSLMS